MKKLNILLIAGFFAVTGLGLSLQQIFAATGSLYLTPNKANVQKDSNVTLSLRLNPGEAVNAVESTITFDSSKLDFVNLNGSTSAFTTEIVPPTVGAGSVSIARVKFAGNVTSDSMVTQITLKAKQGSGTTTVSVSGNASTPTGNYTNPATAGTTITLTSPAPPPNPPTPPTNPTNPTTPDPDDDTPSDDTSPSTPSPSDPGSSTGTPTTKPEVKVDKSTVQYTKAGLSLTSSKPVKVYAVYGVGGRLTQQTPVSDFSQSHTITFDETILVPGTTYNYKIIYEDAEGNKTEGEVQTFKTKGYSLRVKILGKDNKPLSNKQVTIHSEPQTATTDKNGVVEFKDLPPGAHTVEYEQDGKKYTQAVLVEDIVQASSSGEQVASIQNVAVIYDNLQVKSGLNLGLLIGLLLAILILVAVFLGIRRGTFAQIQQRFATSKVVPGPVGGPTQPTEVKASQEEPAIFHHAYPKVPQPGATVEPVEKPDDRQ